MLLQQRTQNVTVILSNIQRRIMSNTLFNSLRCLASTVISNSLFFGGRRVEVQVNQAAVLCECDSSNQASDSYKQMQIILFLLGLVFRLPRTLRYWDIVESCLLEISWRVVGA